ncbi:hypothetical protein [Microbacterium indicum]|uniref:hypothetical protein n=1 Tax=Microbacterium indicum TaxID=358100 RepID=UPI000408347A|nr:hypothetical protein [Microbacterium indicum]
MSNGLPNTDLPIDITTDLGRLRVLLGDIEMDGETYAVFRDYELQAILTEGASVLRAASIAVRRLALEYSTAGQSIAVDDVRLDVTGRGPNLLAVAKSFSDEADADDERRGAGAFADVFEVASTGRFEPSWGAF